MSTGSAVTMKELELEHAELLPSRETLCVCKCASQYGLINIAILNGSLDGNVLTIL
jgi:hypothetical protein